MQDARLVLRIVWLLLCATWISELPRVPNHRIPVLRSFPPAGHRLPYYVFAEMIRANRKGFNEVLLNSLKEYLGAASVMFLPSGRAALWLILRLLSAKSPEKQEVIVPAYTCPAVVSAVLRAGLKPILCDINLEDFGYSLNSLAGKINQHTLAVIVVHLFGYPADTKSLLEWARQRDFFVIEDSAQAFGNTYPDLPQRKLGLSGDAGFFSFGRGKPLSVLHGGLLATNSEDLYVDSLRLHATLEDVSNLENLKYFIHVAAYNFFLHPRLYWIPQRIPFLRLGETIFEEGFALSKGLVMALAAVRSLLRSVDANRAIRKENVRCYANGLYRLSGVEMLPTLDYPFSRYPLRLKNRKLRDCLVARLVSKGTGAGLFYPCPLNELKGLREILDDRSEYPNARQFAQTLITLPVHEGVTPAIRDTIISIVREGLQK